VAVDPAAPSPLVRLFRSHPDQARLCLAQADTTERAVTAIQAVTEVAEATEAALAIDAVVAAVRRHDHPAVNEAVVPYLHVASRVAPAAVADHAGVFGALLETGFPSDHDGAPAVTLGHWEEVKTIISALGHLVKPHPGAVIPAAGGLLAWAAGNLGQASVRHQLLEVLTAAVVPEAPFEGRLVDEPYSVPDIEPTGHANGLAPHVEHLVRIADRRPGTTGVWALLYAIALEAPTALAEAIEPILERWGHGVGTEGWLYTADTILLLAEQAPATLRPHGQTLCAAAARALAEVDRRLTDAVHPLSRRAEYTALRALWCAPHTLSILATVARRCPAAAGAAVDDDDLRQRVHGLGSELWLAVPPLVEAAAETPPVGAVALLDLLAAIAEATGAFVVHHTDTLRAIRAEATDQQVRAAATAALETVDRA
jgi:hypothetical protein